MIDKVIEALDCRANDSDLPCILCHYYKNDGKVPYCNFKQAMKDAVDLLKRQSSIKQEIMNAMTPEVDNIKVTENRWYEAGFNEGLQTAIKIINKDVM